MSQASLSTPAAAITVWHRQSWVSRLILGLVIVACCLVAYTVYTLCNVDGHVLAVLRAAWKEFSSDMRQITIAQRLEEAAYPRAYIRRRAISRLNSESSGTASIIPEPLQSKNEKPAASNSPLLRSQVIDKEVTVFPLSNNLTCLLDPPAIGLPDRSREDNAVESDVNVGNCQSKAVTFLANKDSHINTSGTDTTKAAVERSGELECRAALERIFGVPFPKVRPQFLTNPTTGRRLELDCYAESLKIACEYQGIQHSVFPNPFHSTIEQFRAQQLRDKLKRILATMVGVTLLTVPHTIKRANIESFLRHKLARLDLLQKLR
jgi:hypothetical protein